MYNPNSESYGKLLSLADNALSVGSSINCNKCTTLVGMLIKGEIMPIEGRQEKV